MRDIWKPSSRCDSERDVEVLSKSTIPTGILVGRPSSISKVKKNITSNGNSTMQKR